MAVRVIELISPASPVLIDMLVPLPAPVIEIINEVVAQQIYFAEIILDEGAPEAVDNVNTVFTTLFNYVAGKIAVYYNGVQQRHGLTNDFTEASANSIIFNTAPKKGIISFNYVKA